MGAGKSTILELTKSALADDEEDYIQVSFDAWMFQGYDDAKAALLETIATTLVKRAEADKSLSAKAKDFASRVNKIRLMGLLMDAGGLIAGVPTFGGFQKLFGMFSGGENGEYDFEDVKNGVEGAGEVANKNKDLLSEKRISLHLKKSRNSEKRTLIFLLNLVSP
ncbi:P-loop NTPase fold protein [Pseudobowmanella zhangzhouensis]|uniref:P-loop NTPase fold protein n=1 Tax=Pseudobowmanella zhangzhouensis TaxID=1537679 RepID=UPI0036232FD9